MEHRFKKIKELKELLETPLGGDVEKSIEVHKKYNNVWNPFDDGFTEMLHACMYDTKCTGSAGLGWDNLDKGESKYSSRVQSRNCKNCGSKVMFFINTCQTCGSKDLKSPKDSRWGISSEAHLKYYDSLKGYRLALLEPIEDDANCREFVLRSWFIETKNPYLTSYAKTQFDSVKSNHINFMPLGRDFYYSSPCLHLKAYITYDGVDIEYFNIENKTPEEIPKKFLTDMTINEIMSAKKMGKERGTVVRKQ